MHSSHLPVGGAGNTETGYWKRKSWTGEWI